MASVLYEYHNPTWDDVTQGLSFFGQQKRAQIFKVGSVGANVSFEFNGLKIPGSKIGAPGNVDVAIYEVDVDGKPTGDAISTGVYNGNQFAVYPAKTAMGALNSMTACILEADTEYAIVFYDSTGNASNYVVWGGDRTDNTYPGGWVCMSNDGGETWTVYDGDPNNDYDLSFEIYGATVLSGTIASTSNVPDTELKSIEELVGTVTVESALAGDVISIEKLAGSLGAQSALTGNAKSIEELVGSLSAQSALTGKLQWLQELTGLIAAQSTAAANVNLVLVHGLAGTIAGQSELTSANLKFIAKLSGLIEAQSGLTGNLKGIEELAGSIGATASLTGLLNAIEFLAGSLAAQSALTGNLQRYYIQIPPFMEKDLIDPYSRGAWLWLVQIAIPGQATVRIARNTEDVPYDGNDFDKFNLQIGEQIFSGDGSIPRVTLRVSQDVNRKIENLVNETEGALGAAVKLIRVNEKYLSSTVKALEFDYDNLASESDTEWVTFTLGVPNPLTQRFPLQMFSSSMCPEATPSLFGGPRCQYDKSAPEADQVCTGTYEDCYGKGNAVHWGGELGLDPSVVEKVYL